MADEAYRKERSKRVKDRIEQHMKELELMRKQEMFRKRIDLARQGVRAYQNHAIPEAITAFQTYLKILEDWKGAEEGGLSPSKFDPKRDVPELLLISGVYWDLAKIYDRTKSPKKLAQFHQYIKKFVLFSKGTPFQPISAETLRKYLNTDRPLHRKEFQDAYIALGGSKCFIATSLLDLIELETLITLQSYRDQVLVCTWLGRLIIRAYYAVGPLLSCWLSGAPRGLRSWVARGLSGIARWVAPRS